MQVELIAHAAGGPGPVERLTVMVERVAERLWLRFVVEGDVDAIAWPPSRPSGRGDDLWKHTCFEAFVATDEGYLEYNLSPSGQWASYWFDGYRNGMRRAEQTVEIAGLDAASDLVALEARVDIPVGSTRLGLSAVIEDRLGRKTWWALAHAAAQPDFHHADSFILSLPPLEHS